MKHRKFMALLYGKGLSMQEYCVKLGLSKQTLCKILNDNERVKANAERLGAAIGYPKEIILATLEDKR